MLRRPEIARGAGSGAWIGCASSAGGSTPISALYRGGALAASSAPVLQDLGVVAQLMDPSAFRALALRRRARSDAAWLHPLSWANGSVSAWSSRADPPRFGVLATPQLADDSALAAPAARSRAGAAARDARRRGGGAGRARGAPRARSRARSPNFGVPRWRWARASRCRPIPAAHRSSSSRCSARSSGWPPTSARSQNALEDARRRTATVLGTVATGVVGLDPEGRVIIANRQAVDLLGIPLEEGEPFARRLRRRVGAAGAAVRRFLERPRPPMPTGRARRSAADGSRSSSRRSARMSRGVVLALNDVTDLSRAERVLAWGEMARQVAHEIKNPLTPMRLGVQHLQRVYRDRRPDFDRTLEDTAERILAEIDRLDTIARAFSRFAAPADESSRSIGSTWPSWSARWCSSIGWRRRGATVRLDVPARLAGGAARATRSRRCW